MRYSLCIHLLYLLDKLQNVKLFVCLFVWLFVRCFFLCLFLFVCLFVFVPLENFSNLWRRHHDRRRASSFDLCSALMTIEQWGFFSVSYLLWHGASVYNGHIHPVTLTTIVERLPVELSLPFLRLGLSRLRFEHKTFPLRGERSNPTSSPLRPLQMKLTNEYQEFFTHVVTSHLPLKDWKFWPMLGSHGQWAVRNLLRVKPTVTRDIR